MADEFDEALYLRANPDVSVMISRGIFRSALEHWKNAGSQEHAIGRRRSGFYEHDLIYDEQTYMTQNEDVRRVVGARAMGSGYEHWIRFGRLEFARGRRWGPFAAKSGAIRPHCVPVSHLGALLVATLQGELGPEATARYRIGTEAPRALDPGSLACTAPLSVVDVCDRASTMRLILAWVPGEIATARGVRPVTCRVTSPERAPIVLDCLDAGRQAFFFPSVDDANALVLAARALAADGEFSRALVRAAIDFAIERLQRGVWSSKEARPFAIVHLDALRPNAGVGLHATGWLLPGDRHVERLRVWAPETGECVDFQDHLVRIERPDVRAHLGDELVGATEEPVGFSALLRLPEASTLGVSRLLFGITMKGGAERWVVGGTSGS